MFFSKAFFVLVLVLFIHKSCTLRVEINVGSKGKQVKLICVPDKLNDTKDNVLWEGVKLGIHDLHSLAMRNIPIPNIRVSSNRLKCYLQTSESDSTSKKSRVGREVAGTVQTENGNCPPGYRIDQDRCYPCFPGSFTSGQETECFLCPRNFYMSKEAADTCWPCPEDTFTRTEGATSVDACVDLSYSESRGGIGHANKWYIIGIVMILFIIISWIIIAYLLIRCYCFGRKKVISSEDGDFLMKSTTPDGKCLAKHITNEHFLDHNENTFDRYHINDSPTKRKLLKFDVDIKGSAIFTEQGSTKTDGSDTEDKGLKRHRKDTISLISGLKSNEIGGSLSPELQSSEIKMTSPELEKNRTDFQNVKNSYNHSKKFFENNKVPANLENNEVKRGNYAIESVSVNGNLFDSKKSDKLQDSSNIRGHSFDNGNLNPVHEQKDSIGNSDVEKDLKFSQNSESLNLVNDARSLVINDDSKIMDDGRNANHFNDSKRTDLRKTENKTNDSSENSNQASDMKCNRETFQNGGKNKMIDNLEHLNQVNDSKLGLPEEASSSTTDTPEEISNSGTEKSSTPKEISNSGTENSSTPEEISNSGTENSSTPEEISIQNVKALDNGISSRKSLTAKKNSVFDYRRKPIQNGNGKPKQNSLYYPSYQNRPQQAEQTFPISTFRKIQSSSFKNPINSIKRSSEDRVYSDGSLNARYRRSSTDSSSSAANSISKKWLNKSQKTLPTKPNEKPNEIRITIEPEKEKEDKVLEKNTYSTIPQFISSKQGRSLTERTTCSIHQGDPPASSPCHVEVVWLHQLGCRNPYFEASPNL
ncbi:hypothetical protein AVEN_207456-1 [Araneus ventricosus]|uniref:Tyrosine-protein kinase ephrin type A/B receptor-like domain-containing protein n=1 Tax=Araneus ventricosus TaxID=182803 RepID=A0A4Y2E930_ARAVE|nr:hypothetical protein AVEN_207456-1 [Araneus ventricosus]